MVSSPPQRIHEPVGYGTVLYELAPLEAAHEAAPDRASGTSEAGARPTPAAAVFRARYSGRFWHRPSPQDPPFVQAGDVIRAGSTLGLVEVMKTFTHLAYTPGPELPQRARVIRALAADGAEVSEGAPLLELEPA